jgi:hypothetical protein
VRRGAADAQDYVRGLIEQRPYTATVAALCIGWLIGRMGRRIDGLPGHRHTADGAADHLAGAMKPAVNAEPSPIEPRASRLASAQRALRHEVIGVAAKVAAQADARNARARPPRAQGARSFC